MTRDSVFWRSVMYVGRVARGNVGSGWPLNEVVRYHRTVRQFGSQMRNALAIAILLLCSSLAVAQQNFSCSYGARGACLNYGDKVVDQDSVCFSNLTCGYKGFVCKAKLDDVVDEYDSLVMKHNELVRKHRELASTARELLETKRSIESDYEDLEAKFKGLTYEHEQQSEELRAIRSQYGLLLQTLRNTSSSTEKSSKKSK